ncbi:Hypothetical protein AT6N2_L0559 [Agrobacterium tumefaciens]|nr:Hypothetical protein AT6N2_L0559 [Agrobacterium tumefaciens]
MEATSTLPVAAGAGAAVVGAGAAGAAGLVAVGLAVDVGVAAGAEVSGAASALPKIAFLILSKKLMVSSPYLRNARPIAMSMQAPMKPAMR